MVTSEKRSIEDELALFEKEISSVESHTRSIAAPVTNDGAMPPSSASAVCTAPSSTSSHPSVQPSIGPAIRPEPRPIMGPFFSGAVVTNSVAPATVRPAPPFLPHVMMRPGFIQQTNLAMRFIPPQGKSLALRYCSPCTKFTFPVKIRLLATEDWRLGPQAPELQLPVVNFMRPPVQLQPQPSVLESGPSLYEDAEKKDANKDADNDAEARPSSLKTQVLASDVEAVAQKKHSEAAHRSTYIGQVMRGEKKMKRFLRCGGGQVWEDKSLAEWDPNDFRIFCGDLGNEVSDELLAKAFRKYPSFQKAKVIREARTNKSKGYGFVSFKHQDDFVRACREMDGKYVGNRPIKLRKSNWKERNMDVVKKKKKQKQKLGLS